MNLIATIVLQYHEEAPPYRRKSLSEQSAAVGQLIAIAIAVSVLHALLLALLLLLLLLLSPSAPLCVPLLEKGRDALLVVQVVDCLCEQWAHTQLSDFTCHSTLGRQWHRIQYHEFRQSALRDAL